MSFDVSPLGGLPPAVSAVDRARRAQEPQGASFADAVGRSGTPPIPDEVWDQVDAAARLADDLRAQGREIRFDVHKLDGEVVASLVEADGLLRPMLLTDVVDVTRLAHRLRREGA
jgi:hypothetical protein